MCVVSVYLCNSIFFPHVDNRCTVYMYMYINIMVEIINIDHVLATEGKAEALENEEVRDQYTRPMENQPKGRHNILT